MSDKVDSTPSAQALLSVDRLETYYGKSHVLRGLSFEVPSGAITVLLGRNGAGKTTTLRSIMGLTPPRAGSVRFRSRDITGQAPHRVFRLGIGYVPEGRQIFPHLDVGENIRLAQRPARDGPSWTLERIFDYFPVLRDRWRQRGRSLSGGESRCWPSPAPSPATPSCSCSTSRPRGWPPGSSASWRP